jgi:D-alanyl-D-alanine carboxypeptidase
MSAHTWWWVKPAMSAVALACAPVTTTLQSAIGPSPNADTAMLRVALDSIRQAIGANGLSAAIIWADGSEWSAASGEAWSGVPATPATLFDAGSITKSYTAALVLRLVDEGRLALDDSISGWFPELPGAKGVTVRDLLRQTSGLADYASSPEFLPAIRGAMAGPWPPERNLRFVGEPAFAPGERWQYSNTNYVLLGLIASRVAGQPLSELLRTRLLDSLGLTNTFLSGEDSLAGGRAHAFLDFTDDGKADDLSAFVPDPATTRGAGGAGAIVATAADLARFARAYYSGTLVPDELREDATSWVDRGDGWMYGFGMIAAPHGADILLGHLGNTAGQSAGVWHSRQANVTVAILTNVHGVRMADPVRTLLDYAVGRAKR